ncbi:ABC transporter permease [Clostridium amazonitimonense]|uniref:ABC transporter permease n=1 Tax=Clostridium amazonitimonense TaxID=1499689 RepID=UPI0005094985|nr:ABC transporter permease [Clostridium amazonitimonense]
MWKKKIKQKKMQFILIAIILMVASSIFAISMSFTSTVSKYTSDYYAGENIKDIVVQTYNDDVISKAESFIMEKETNEKDIRKTKGLMVDRQVFLGDKNLDLGMANLIIYEGMKAHPWDVVITEGEKATTPSKGTIWVSNLLSDSKNLKIGDKLKIKDGDEYKYLTISSLVNDSLVPSSVMGYNNLYVNSNDYGDFNELIKSQYIGYNSSKEGNDATSDLVSYVGDSVDGVIYDKWITIFAANAGSQITSGVGLSTAILIFIVSIVIIRFVLWNNILKEYKSIGIYKSLGFTSKQIRNIYLKSFGIVGIFAITFGSFFSIWLVNYLVEISIKYIGIYKGGINNFNFIVLTIILMSFVLISNIYLLLRRINKIKPVEAFRIGITSSKEKFKKSIIKDALSPMSMAINDIFKYKKQSLIIVTVLSLVIYLSVFLVSVNHSIVNMKDNTWNIFGLLQGDVTLDFPSGEASYDEALEEVKRDPRVLGVRECSFDVGKVVYIDVSRYNIKNAQIITYLYDNYDNNQGFNVSIVKGRNPKNKNEIALSAQILKDVNLDIGDYIDMKILGEETSLLITGSYVGIMSNNYNMRMTLDAVPKEIRKNLNNLNINITLKDKDDYEVFKNEYKDKYEVCSIDICPSVVTTTSKSIIEIVIPVTTIILLGIILFSILNIVNLIIMNNTDNRRNNAIMKSLGFSNSYILKRTLYRIMLLTGISSLIGFILNATTSKIVFKAAMMGIDSLIIPDGKVISTIVFIEILTIGATIISMFSIRKISTVELMEE